MKKLLLSLAVSATAAFTFAQPTMNFESWTGTGTSIEPSGWISANELAIVGVSQSAFQETTPANVHGGTSALKLVSVTNTAVAGLPNPIGLAAPGTDVGFSPKFGFPNASRPNSMSFYCMYTPATGDTAECAISIWNSATHDTLAKGIWKIGVTINSYTLQTVTLNYNSNFASEFPDSMALTFSSTKLFNPNNSLCMNCGKVGSILWIDDISFIGWNSVNETEMSKGVSVFPNPVHDLATITVDHVSEAATVEVFDITGRLITTIPFSDAANAVDKKSAIMPTLGMSAGFYSLSVYDKSKHLLRNGKLNVVK